MGEIGKYVQFSSKLRVTVQHLFILHGQEMYKRCPLHPSVLTVMKLELVAQTISTKNFCVDKLARWTLHHSSCFHGRVHPRCLIGHGEAEHSSAKSPQDLTSLMQRLPLLQLKDQGFCALEILREKSTMHRKLQGEHN